MRILQKLLHEKGKMFQKNKKKTKPSNGDFLRTTIRMGELGIAWPNFEQTK